MFSIIIDIGTYRSTLCVSVRVSVHVAALRIIVAHNYVGVDIYYIFIIILSRIRARAVAGWSNRWICRHTHGTQTDRLEWNQRRRFGATICHLLMLICTPQESTIHLHTAGINNTCAHRRNQ